MNCGPQLSPVIYGQRNIVLIRIFEATYVNTDQLRRSMFIILNICFWGMRREVFGFKSTLLLFKLIV